jgi:hypothetical protein
LVTAGSGGEVSGAEPTQAGKEGGSWQAEMLAELVDTKERLRAFEGWIVVLAVRKPFCSQMFLAVSKSISMTTQVVIK